MRNKITYLLTLAALCSSYLAYGQLVTSANQTPAQLVQNVLVGNGVTVSNIQYQGGAASIGYFDGSNCNIGLDEGIIMTTGTIFNNGTASERYGPHGPNDYPNAGLNNNTPGFGTLTNLLNTGSGNPPTTYNATVLSFDFVPFADIVEFKYVFASEEYPEYVGSQFNDVFGFFISGPGLGSNTNIALVPNSNPPLPVAINNINAGLNSQHFIDNGDGFTFPQLSNDFYVQYDGFTKVLTASANVQCGETYRIVLAIADVGDGIFDSGIFLEANSFSSPVEVDISYELSSQAYGNDYTMAEGCTSAEVTLTRSSNNANQPFTVPISVAGTAQMGVDFSNVPSSVTFNAGQLQTSFTIEAFGDTFTEGLETILLNFGIEDPCGINDFVQVQLAIDDIVPVEVFVSDTTVVCPGQEVILTAIAQGGGNGYNYSWSTGQNTQTILVNPNVTTSYTVTITDNCLNDSAEATAQVTVPVYDPLTVSTSSDFITPCPFEEHVFSAQAIGGAAGDYLYTWTNAQGNLLSSQANLTISPPASTFFEVTVTDLCGNSAQGQVNYLVTSPPLAPFVQLDTTICIGDSALLRASGTGGFGSINYYWPHSGETTANVWVTPSSTTTYTVEVSDACQTFTTSASATVSTITTIANFNMSNNLLEDYPVTFENTSTNASIFLWDFGTGAQANTANATYTFPSVGQYEVTLYAENELGCLDSITKPLFIRAEATLYVPNTFTPDFNRYNELFRAVSRNVSELNVVIFNRWGEAVFSSAKVDFAWDGNYKGSPVPDGVYSYRIEYVTINNERKTVYGHVNVLR